VTKIADTQSKRRSMARLTVGVVLTSALVFGTFAGTAGAEERDREHRDYHHRDWNGGYYPTPPVVYGYGTPYYAPPVVYGPGIGLNFIIR
jgi:hypothetical protein